MQRALILLNPCGREAGRHKLKNGLKTQKMHFLPVFELTLASLTAIWVEPHQCLLHQSSPWKLVTNYVLEWMGLNLYDYDGLQPKMTHTKHSWGECIVHLTDVLTIFLWSHWEWWIEIHPQLPTKSGKQKKGPKKSQSKSRLLSERWS